MLRLLNVKSANLESQGPVLLLKVTVFTACKLQENRKGTREVKLIKMTDLHRMQHHTGLCQLLQAFGGNDDYRMCLKGNLKKKVNNKNELFREHRIT